MSFHGHGFCESLAAFRQSEHDGGDSLCHVQHLVYAHADVGALESALQLFVALQCHEADADVRLDALACEVEHGAYLRQDYAAQAQRHRVGQRHAQERGSACALQAPQRAQFHHEPAGGFGRLLLLRQQAGGQLRDRGRQRAARALPVGRI